jgi:hypothetical protein
VYSGDVRASGTIAQKYNLCIYLSLKKLSPIEIKSTIEKD